VSETALSHSQVAIGFESEIAEDMQCEWVKEEDVISTQPPEIPLS
jgi:hypothetical protein